MNRRHFMKQGFATTAGMVVLDAGSRKGYAKNNEVTLAVVGIHGMGKGHFQIFSGLERVRVKTICDVDERLYPGAEKFAREECGVDKVHFVHDLRRVLDDKDIDAVTIATPEHWHALQTIWACQAGKDVYVEKPVSHNIYEGRKAVEAARRYQRIVQAGTQKRSYPHVIEAVRLLREGIIGDVYMARGICFKPRESIGHKTDSPVPPGVHYDLWLGPAPQRPFNENRFHYNWHWFWDYGCAEIGNQAPHELDCARWGLGKHTHPRRIQCSGGYFAFDSDQETPNTQTALYEWEDGTILQFDVRGLCTNAEEGMLIGNFFYGSKGWMKVDINGFKVFLGRKNEPGPAMDAVIVNRKQAVSGAQGFAEGDAHTSSRMMHYQNFIDAVRLRNGADLNADIEEGHISTSLSHLANISYRLGRELTFDTHAERFVGDDVADAYLTRNYRYPYVVPEVV